MSTKPVQIKWTAEVDQRILLYLLKNYEGKVPYDGIATELGCTTNAVSKHIQKLKKSIAETGIDGGSGSGDDEDMPAAPKKRKRAPKAEGKTKAEGAANGKAKSKKIKLVKEEDEDEDQDDEE